MHISCRGTQVAMYCNGKASHEAITNLVRLTILRLLFAIFLELQQSNWIKKKIRTRKSWLHADSSTCKLLYICYTRSYKSVFTQVAVAVHEICHDIALVITIQPFLTFILYPVLVCPRRDCNVQVQHKNNELRNIREITSSSPRSSKSTLLLIYKQKRSPRTRTVWVYGTRQKIATIAANARASTRASGAPPDNPS